MGVMDYRIRAGAAGVVYEYNVPYSCRFTPGDSSALKRTPGSVGNRQIYTISTWAKVCNQEIGILEAWADASNLTAFYVDDASFRIYGRDSGDDIYWNSSGGGMLFRDPGAWYHICIAVDLTESSASDMIKVWVNNELIVNWGTQTGPPAAYSSDINNTIEHWIGSFRQNSATRVYPDQYLADYHLIDGTALTPSSFAEVNADTGQWQAKSASVTYGTNGFHLKFEDSADLGNDSSGNGNDYTATNLAATDQVGDGPKAADSGVGSTSTGGNFPTWNPLCYSPNSSFQEGNLQHTGTATASGNTACTFTPPATGKWYWEEHCSNIDSTQWPFIGTVDSTVYEIVGTWSNNDGRPGESESNGGWKISADGEYETDGGGTTAGGVSFNDTTDVIQFALDHDNGALYYGKNNVWYTPTATTGDPTSGASKTGAVMTWTAGTRSFIPAAQQYNGSALVLNCGQDSSFAGNLTAQGNSDGNDIGDFYYTPPTDYLALCSSNLGDPSIALPGENFNTVLYTGDGADDHNITGVGFQPDWTWIKCRSNADSHALYDAVRGATKFLMSNSNSLEQTEADALVSFDSDGFTLDDDATGTRVNVDTRTYASWNWKAGGASTVTNNDGSIESEVSVNTTAGFSIFTYTGTGAAGTVGHGLSSKPDMIIYKGRNTTSSWPVYYERTTAGALGFPLLESDGIKIDSPFTWNSTVFTFTSASGYSNTSGTDYIAYAFNSVEGYSKVGTYTGNGNDDGTFVYLGFRPAFTLVKRVDVTENWWLEDNKRNTYNPQSKLLYADLNNVEATEANKDYVSNGMKMRLNNANWNASGGTYLYLAMAKNPFKYSPAR